MLSVQPSTKSMEFRQWATSIASDLVELRREFEEFRKAHDHCNFDNTSDGALRRAGLADSASDVSLCRTGIGEIQSPSSRETKRLWQALLELKDETMGLRQRQIALTDQVQSLEGMKQCPSSACHKNSGDSFNDSRSSSDLMEQMRTEFATVRQSVVPLYEAHKNLSNQQEDMVGKWEQWRLEIVEAMSSLDRCVDESTQHCYDIMDRCCRAVQTWQTRFEADAVSLDSKNQPESETRSRWQSEMEMSLRELQVQLTQRLDMTPSLREIREDVDLFLREKSRGACKSSALKGSTAKHTFRGR